MASASKTPNLNLPQWVGTEKPERTDFNAAFDAIDTTVASHLAENAMVAKFEITANKSMLNVTEAQVLFDVVHKQGGADFAELENGRIKIVKGGTYLLVGTISYANKEVGRYLLAIEGCANRLKDESPARISLATIARKTENNLVSATTFQNTGGSLDLTKAEVQVYRLGGL